MDISDESVQKISDALNIGPLSETATLAGGEKIRRAFVTKLATKFTAGWETSSKTNAKIEIAKHIWSLNQKERILFLRALSELKSEFGGGKSVDEFIADGDLHELIAGYRDSSKIAFNKQPWQKKTSTSPIVEALVDAPLQMLGMLPNVIEPVLKPVTNVLTEQGQVPREEQDQGGKGQGQQGQVP